MGYSPTNVYDVSIYFSAWWRSSSLQFDLECFYVDGGDLTVLQSTF